ncbi:glycosyltransferase family 9 protein [uncultured Mucilaginibacter sp.]|uniref:glycosyltransferase family 9 protein n=1 Tax=uncultured Mucilaginibacter sp. TaxID=797541 RepID=UPI0025F14034|nr:glycosyltransferase family 9 protein [uncultured Mucilaginibacter sp.]
MDIKNRNLFRISRFIILRLPPVLKFLALYREPERRLLIIKTDAIGDYILFRNFFEIIAASETFKGYQIDVLGNTLWRDMALKYDRKFADEFFFFNPDDLYSSPLKAFKLSIKLFWKNYDTVLQPAFSRTFVNDGLAGFTAAKNVIGFVGDTERIDARYKLITDKFYTSLFALPQNIVFEFNRSKFFVEQVLLRPIAIDGPFIAIENKSRNGLVIFPGAGVGKRRWEKEKFLDLIKLILLHSKAPISIAGGLEEMETVNYLINSLPAGSLCNLAGKTTLNELIELIGNAALIISNETSAIHIAAAVETPAICVLGGGHFGRFAPYPVAVEDAPVCVYEQMDCYNCNWNCIYQIKEGDPFPCITAVTLEKVWADVQQYL